MNPLCLHCSPLAYAKWGIFARVKPCFNYFFFVFGIGPSVSHGFTVDQNCSLVKKHNPSHHQPKLIVPPLNNAWSWRTGWAALCFCHSTSRQPGPLGLHLHSTTTGSAAEIWSQENFLGNFCGKERSSSSFSGWYHNLIDSPNTSMADICRIADQETEARSSASSGNMLLCLMRCPARTPAGRETPMSTLMNK